MKTRLFAAMIFCFFVVTGNVGAQTLPADIITKSVRIKPDVYAVNGDGIHISGSKFTLDLKGVRLVGNGKNEGIGIHITNATGVTIKNADVSRFKWGIVVERGVKVELINCKSVFNADYPPGTVIDESGKEPEDQWGGGILLRDSNKCRVTNAFARYQWDGVDVVNSNSNVIEKSDFSYNGNWGVHFWNSSKNDFEDNRAVWCTTGAGKLYQALTGWQTYDSQAVGIDHNSCDNHIGGNDLRFGGDGIFIRANEGPITPGTVVPPKNGSHRNVLVDNDCSFSPNNAIEVDLVDDTKITGNICSNSHYGMWLGYSRRCLISANICLNNTEKAVEIENGQDDKFVWNMFGCTEPRKEATLVYLRQNERDKTPSGVYYFEQNIFHSASIGVQLKNTSAKFIGNVFYNAPQQMTLVKGDAASKFTEQGSSTIKSLLEMDTHYTTITAANWKKLPPLEPKNGPKIKKMNVEKAKVGETVTIEGEKLKGGRVLLNGKAVALTDDTTGRLTFKVPDDIKPGTHVNVLWERGEWPDYERLLPLQLEIATL